MQLRILENTHKRRTRAVTGGQLRTTSTPSTTTCSRYRKVDEVPSPGTTLQNRYRLQRPLGRGAMGTVFRAVDTVTGRPLAIKEVLSIDTDMRLAFEREAHLLAQLEHPALPAVVDFFSDENALYLAMSYIPDRKSVV